MAKRDKDSLFSSHVSRREMLKTSITVATAAAFSAGVCSLPQTLFAAPAKPILSVATGANYKNIVIDAIGALGGMKKFISGGERVVVKPNIAWDRPPELGANVHPTVVKTIVEMCLDAGAKQIKLFDRTCDDARLTYESSGIKAAIATIKDPRVKLEFFDENEWKFVELDIPKGKKLKKWSFYKDAVNADFFINVPIAKSHGSTTLSLSMKNLMGIIGGVRGEIHWEIHQKLADLASAFKSHLIILDATRIVTKRGPSTGDKNNVKVLNKVIAGTNQVAVDSYGATLFGKTGSEIGYIKNAYDMGLGEIDMSKVKIIGS